MSDRCASALATSLMKDLGIVTEEDVSSIVDRSKIRREKGRVRKEEVEKRLPDVSKLTCIGFDSRNDPKVGYINFLSGMRIQNSNISDP